MSAIYMDVYIQPENDLALNKYKELIKAIETQDYETIEAMDTEELLEVEDVFDSVESEISGSFIHLKFDTGTLSTETEDMVNFLFSLGAAEMEVAAFNSQCGEYEFYKNDEVFEGFEGYHGVQWNWIKNPFPDLAGQTIVMTGVLDTYSPSDWKEYIEQYHGSVSSTVNSDTTLVVTGANPEQSIIQQAIALNIPVLTQDAFTEKYRL
ncbi:BRCT domain-containing protein [Saezia sanguinis]|uniref:BRCT domain-containing protein n=1 Tax=Saezia sanguinis TaxID=1965230 RepID=UPI003063E168